MSFVQVTRQDLLATRTDAGAWPYRPGGAGAPEPTATVALALLATSGGEDTDEAHDAAISAARWLATQQAPDGSVPVSATLKATWPTAYALLLWIALDAEPEARGRALSYLLAHQGLHGPRSGDGILGHDTAIVGWPWIHDTHSWIEPTSAALMALQRAGHGDHPRAVEGRRMIVDRALPSGGWNCGITTVFGTELRPVPAPTGLALLSLAGRGAPEAALRGAAEYLERTLPRTRAAMSLAWGVLGLSAIGRAPSEAGAWLESARDTARHDCLLLSLLLLAAGDALPLLGVTSEPPR